MTDLGERTLTADQAVRLVRPGNRVFVGTACATPRQLVAALEALPDPPADVTLVHGLTDRVGRTDAEGKAHTAYRHRVFYVGSDVRDLLPTGLIEYVPMSLADVPAMFTDGHLPLDVALVQVAPPDDDGMCSLGVSVDITRAAVLAATTVIAEINPAMPRTRGDSLIPADRIDHAVWVDTPVTEYLHEPAEGVGEQIARYVARLVDDRSTLQIGLGRVPNQMLRHLSNRHDLSVHSEVITEPVAELVEKGVITGSVVGSWAMGTRRLYDLLESDERFSLRSIEHVCDPAEIARHERMVSVTQAFSIDLSGQVCTERLDGQLYGGLSTGPDFHRGTLRAAHGTPVICLAVADPSGTAGGPRRARARRTRRPGPPVGALGGHRVRHRVPVRQVPRRASPGPHRDRAPRRPARAAGGGAGARHRRRRPAAAQPHGVPRRRGARADAARRTARCCSGRRAPSTVVPCRSCSTGCPRRTCRRGSSRS